MKITEKKVLSLIKKGNAREAVSIIEDKLDKAENKSELFLLLGLASIYLFDFTEAKMYLHRALNENKDKINITAMEALAFVNLKENRIDEAVSIYLSILEIDPKNKIAKEKLDNFKKSDSIERNIRQIHVSHFVEILHSGIRIQENLYLFLIFLAIVILVILIVLMNLN